MVSLFLQLFRINPIIFYERPSIGIGIDLLPDGPWTGLGVRGGGTGLRLDVRGGDVPLKTLVGGGILLTLDMGVSASLVSVFFFFLDALRFLRGEQNLYRKYLVEEDKNHNQQKRSSSRPHKTVYRSMMITPINSTHMHILPIPFIVRIFIHLTPTKITLT